MSIVRLMEYAVINLDVPLKLMYCQWAIVGM